MDCATAKKKISMSGATSAGFYMARRRALLRKMSRAHIVKAEWMLYSFYIKVLFSVQKGLQLGSKQICRQVGRIINEIRLPLLVVGWACG